MKYKVKVTPDFKNWQKSLKDNRALINIESRIARVKAGNLGDSKSVGGRVSEMRIKVGKGYRLYYTKKQNVVIILLCGGTKSTQAADIETAKQLVKEV